MGHRQKKIPENSPGMSISVTTIYAKNSGEAESMARINGIKYDFILKTKLIK
jgi:hypothetical protein